MEVKIHAPFRKVWQTDWPANGLTDRRTDQVIGKFHFHNRAEGIDCLCSYFIICWGISIIDLYSYDSFHGSTSPSLLDLLSSTQQSLATNDIFNFDYIITFEMANRLHVFRVLGFGLGSVRPA